jgi:hypothetical protein
VPAAEGHIAIVAILCRGCHEGFLVGEAGEAPADPLEFGLEGIAIGDSDGVLVIGSHRVIGDNLAVLHARERDAVVVDVDRDGFRGAGDRSKPAEQTQTAEGGDTSESFHGSFLLVVLA